MTSAAKAGHHMIAGTISPNPMYKCPDQMIKVQTAPLNANVSCRYRQVALFGVSCIFKQLHPLGWLAAHAQLVEGIQSPLSSSIADLTIWPPRHSQQFRLSNCPVS